MLQQTTFITMFVVILLVLGLVLFFKFTSASIDQEAYEYEFSQFQQLVHIFPSMPEVQCSKLGVTEDCMDVGKLKAFSEISRDYTTTFGAKTITIKEVYLSPFELTVYDGKPLEWEEERIVSTLVSLYYPEQKIYGIGKLEVRWYEGTN